MQAAENQRMSEEHNFKLTDAYSEPRTHVLTLVFHTNNQRLTWCASDESARGRGGSISPVQVWTLASAGAAQGSPPASDPARNRVSSCSRPTLRCAPNDATEHFLKQHILNILNARNFLLSAAFLLRNFEFLAPDRMQDLERTWGYINFCLPKNGHDTI